MLFEFPKSDPEELEDIVDNYQLVTSTGFDVFILASSERGFGYRKEIAIVLSPSDFENANLMILLAYILLGHPDWRNATIKMFSSIQKSRLEEEQESLSRLIRTGRLPISAKNVEVIAQEHGQDRRGIINERCRDADLIITGFEGKLLKKQKSALFRGYDDVGSVLFVNTTKEIELIGEDAPEEEEVIPTTEVAESEPSAKEGRVSKEEKGKPSENAEMAERTTVGRPSSSKNMDPV